MMLVVKHHSGNMKTRNNSSCYQYYYYHFLSLATKIKGLNDTNISGASRTQYSIGVTTTNIQREFKDQWIVSKHSRTITGLALT
jgi:hypothetical protein